MKKFTVVTSFAPVWLQPNVDTDTIAPMKRLVADYSLPDYTFEPFRFLNGDGDSGQLNPQFPLNQKKFSGAEIFIVGENFGCGSSREPAAIGIAQMGIRCLIGTSFGGIFEKNCFQQGILPIRLNKDTLLTIAAQNQDGAYTVDLTQNHIICPDGSSWDFHVDAVQRERLLEGISDIEYTMKRYRHILSYIQTDKARRPWIYDTACLERSFGGPLR